MIVNNPIQVPLDVTAEGGLRVPLDVTTQSGLIVPLTIDAEIIDDVTPLYHGPTHITPSSDRQTLLTSGYRLSDNVVVDPIPSNYGLITWNGAFLTVS